MTYGNQQALKSYQKLNLQAQVSEASPHQLVQLMLDGALARIAAARGSLDAGELARKGELIGKAIGLVEGLRVALDLEKGGDLAGNLHDLYEYIGRRLLEANLHNDPAILEESANLLREIRDGWVAIAGDSGAAVSAES
jgi:flagellar secretion chaperone FliS